MSISTLANAAATRRTDIFPFNQVPESLAQIARAAATPPSITPPATPSPGAPQASSQIDTALHVLFGYIPTEVLTLYVAVLAAVQPSIKLISAQATAAQAVRPTTAGEWIAFWSFLAATPLVVWLTYGAKIKAAGRPLPLEFAAWPLWEMFAAAIAYCAWAFALPNAPFSTYAWYSAALSGVAVLVASTVLGLLAPFFQRPITIK